MIKVTQITPENLKDLEKQLHQIVGDEVQGICEKEITINGVTYNVISKINNLLLKDDTSYDTPLGGLAFYMKHHLDYQEFGPLSVITKPRIYGTFQIDVTDTQLCSQTYCVKFETQDYEIGDTPEDFNFSPPLMFVKLN